MSRAPDDDRLDDLVGLVVRLASGELSARLTPSPARDAVDAVITGVNLLADELQAVYQGLEERVLQRTAALDLAHRDLERLAMTDALTGLANRTLFNDRVGHAIKGAQRGALPPAVLLLDLDEFKSVNDTLGHGAGDAVLIEVARRLSSVVRQADTVARLGGDEFAILMPAAAEAQVLQVADRCLAALQGPVLLSGGAVWAKASIGVRLGSSEQAADVLLRDADTAMYAAKGRGRGTVAVFTPSMHSDALGRVRVAAELRAAIEQGRLALHFQPVVDLATGAIVSAEALLRWPHAGRGMIPPSEFIAIAEESGLILELGAWVLSAAVSQLASWHRLLPQEAAFAVHVNLSPADIRRKELSQDIDRALSAADVPAARLAVEITETGLMTGDMDGLQTLRDIRTLGVGIQIDDFGTGYSSISYLRQLPVDTVKVDRSLIADIATDAQQYAFVGAILQLISSVGLRAVVEGVETADQRRQLLRLGCNFGQGYFFSRPVPAPQMTGLLVARSVLGRQRSGGAAGRSARGAAAGTAS